MIVNSAGLGSFTATPALYSPINRYFADDSPKQKNDVLVFSFREGTYLNDKLINSLTFKNCFFNEIDDSANIIILDFQNINSINDDFIGSIIDLSRTLKSKFGRKFGRCNVNKNIMESIRQKHLDRIIDIGDDCNSLIAKLRNQDFQSSHATVVLDHEVRASEDVRPVTRTVQKKSLGEVAEIEINGQKVVLRFKQDTKLSSDLVQGLEGLIDLIHTAISDGEIFILDPTNLKYLDPEI